MRFGRRLPLLLFALVSQSACERGEHSPTDSAVATAAPTAPGFAGLRDASSLPLEYSPGDTLLGARNFGDTTVIEVSEAGDRHVERWVTDPDTMVWNETRKRVQFTPE